MSNFFNLLWISFQLRCRRLRLARSSSTGHGQELMSQLPWDSVHFPPNLFWEHPSFLFLVLPYNDLRSYISALTNLLLCFSFPILPTCPNHFNLAFFSFICPGGLHNLSLISWIFCEIVSSHTRNTTSTYLSRTHPASSLLKSSAVMRLRHIAAQETHQHWIPSFSLGGLSILLPTACTQALQKTLVAHTLLLWTSCVNLSLLTNTLLRWVISSIVFMVCPLNCAFPIQTSLVLILMKRVPLIFILM